MCPLAHREYDIGGQSLVLVAKETDERSGVVGLAEAREVDVLAVQVERAPQRIAENLLIRGVEARRPGRARRRHVDHEHMLLFGGDSDWLRLCDSDTQEDRPTDRRRQRSSHEKSYRVMPHGYRGPLREQERRL